MTLPLATDLYPLGRDCIGLDSDLLGDLDGVINFNSEIEDGALDLGMTEQELYGSEVARAPIGE